jgi:hypothetical protein
MIHIYICNDRLSLKALTTMTKKFFCNFNFHCYVGTRVCCEGQRANTVGILLITSFSIGYDLRYCGSTKVGVMFKGKKVDNSDWINISINGNYCFHICPKRVKTAHILTTMTSEFNESVLITNINNRYIDMEKQKFPSYVVVKLQKALHDVMIISYRRWVIQRTVQAYDRQSSGIPLWRKACWKQKKCISVDGYDLADISISRETLQTKTGFPTQIHV